MGKRRPSVKGTNPFERKGGDMPTLTTLTDAMLGDDTPINQELAHFGTDDNGAITVGNFRISKIGLQIAEGVNVDEWQAFGQHIRTMETSIQWIIGDWLAYGERVHGKTYQEVAELTGYSYGALQNLVWVSKEFEISYRYEILSHTHHQTALALCDGDVQQAIEWLERASENGWSVKRMSDEIKGIPLALTPAKGRMAKFWTNFEGFAKKNAQLARKAGEAERRQMADALRKLADELETKP